MAERTISRDYLAKLCEARNTLCEYCEANQCETCIVTHLIDDAYDEVEPETMGVHDLSRDQLIALKSVLLTAMNDRQGRGTAYEELADADNIISDEAVFAEYADTEFTEDDFICSAGGEE